ncbi:MAG TPA: competence/damage-inducible protein A [Bacteroidales bacterium]|nr:competence/damage-inducible protein A [Bacteroidales bacterium]
MIEIITIGDEILIGQIVDTNSAWMAVELNNAGFQLSQITSVHDDAELIKSALDLALEKNDIVLLTGGLGPTKDDLTKLTLADYFDTELVYDESVYQNIESLYRTRPSVLNELTKAQALVPKACTVIQNRVGTAPIMWFERDEKVVVSMPGVPFEMKKAMTDEVIPRLMKKFNRNAVINQTVQVFGYGESSLALKIEEWENALPDYLHLAYLPSFGLVKLRLSGALTNGNELQAEIDRQFGLLDEILGDAIIARNDFPLEKNLGEMLRAKKLTIAVAESCTGGNIAHKITSLAGSSEYFIGSVTAYQNEVKENFLGVSSEDLKSYGAVSQQVVEQMAEGVRKKMNTDISIATSGIAGPNGGTEEKPVGTVWIAVSMKDKTISQKYYFGNHSRENIIERSTVSAMILAMELIKGI